MSFFDDAHGFNFGRMSVENYGGNYDTRIMFDSQRNSPPLPSGLTPQAQRGTEYDTAMTRYPASGARGIGHPVHPNRRGTDPLTYSYPDEALGYPEWDGRSYAGAPQYDQGGYPTGYGFNRHDQGPGNRYDPQYDAYPGGGVPPSYSWDHQQRGYDEREWVGQSQGMANSGRCPPRSSSEPRPSLHPRKPDQPNTPLRTVTSQTLPRASPATAPPKTKQGRNNGDRESGVGLEDACTRAKNTRISEFNESNPMSHDELAAALKSLKPGTAAWKEIEKYKQMSPAEQLAYVERKTHKLEKEKGKKKAFWKRVLGMGA